MANVIVDSNSPAPFSDQLLTLPRHRWRWRTLPFEPPDPSLPQVLDEIGTECREADSTRVPDRRVDNAVTGSFLAKLFREGLARWVRDRRIGVESPMSTKIGSAQIMERTKEIGDQLGIVSDVLETSDRFELTG